MDGVQSAVQNLCLKNQDPTITEPNFSSMLLNFNNFVDSKGKREGRWGEARGLFTFVPFLGWGSDE